MIQVLVIWYADIIFLSSMYVYIIRYQPRDQAFCIISWQPPLPPRAVLTTLYWPPGKAVHWGHYLHIHLQEYKCKWLIKLKTYLLYWYFHQNQCLNIKKTCFTAKINQHKRFFLIFIILKIFVFSPMSEQSHVRA